MKKLFLTLLLMLALAQPGWAAITHRAGVLGSDHINSYGTCVYAGDWSTGDLLVVTGTLAKNGTAPTMNSVTDGLSNTWTVILGTEQLAGSPSDWGVYHFRPFTAWFIATAPSTSSGERTITVYASGSYMNYACDAFVGVATSGTYDTTHDATGVTSGGAETVTDSITTAAANELIIATYIDVGSDGNAQYTSGTGYTLLAELFTNGFDPGFHSEYKILTTAAGSNAATFDIATTNTYKYGIQLTAFKEIAVVGGTPSNAARRRVQ